MGAPAVDFEQLERALAARAPHREALPEGAVRAAVALVLAAAPEGTELLLIRRAVRAGDPWSGHMALPGGRSDPRDRDLADTARRETGEETGVRLGPRGAGLLGELDDLRPTRSRRPRIVVRPFVFGLPERPPVSIDAGEVAYHRWVPLAQLARSRGRERVLHGAELVEVPGFRLGADFVWGMTHRILDPFLELLAEAP